MCEPGGKGTERGMTIKMKRKTINLINTKRMRTRILFSFIASVALLASCGDKNDNGRGGGFGGATMVNAIEVPARTVTAQTAYPTSVEGVVNSAVRPKVSGYVTDVEVDEGQAVKAGQVLFRLETEALSEDAQAAQANVNAAEVEVNRLKPLVEKGIISEVQLQTAEARLAQAKANYQSISANIGYATVKSPITGYVGSINHREGSLVSPSDPTPLTTVSQVDQVFAFFSMNERDYIDFLKSTPGKSIEDKLGNFPPVKLRLINGDVYEHTGQIETVTGQVDPQTGTVSFRARFPNPDRILSQGSSGQVLVPKTYEDVPVIPESATIDRQGRIFVYGVKGDSVVVSRSIRVRDRVNNLIVAGDGVSRGDVIVAQGVQNLRDNAPVKVQMLPFDSVAHSLETVFKY